MKKLFQRFTIGVIILFIGLSAKFIYDIKNATSEVVQIQGLYIFTDSKPVREYDYLGTVKSSTGGFGDSQYTGVRDRLIKKTKKEYPKADAIILNLKSGKADQCDAIKFKN